MNKLSFRRAQLTDLAGLITLENACFTQDKLSPRSIRRFLKTPHTDIFIAEMDRLIIGCAIMIFRKNSSTSRLYSFAIEKSFRQQGIAKTLYSKIEKGAALRGCKAVTLEVRIDNLSAIYFYQTLGYQTIGRYTGFYEDGTDALRMTKNLS